MFAVPLLQIVPFYMGHHHLLVGGQAAAPVLTLCPHLHLVQGEDLEVADQQGGCVDGYLVQLGV